MNEYFGYYDEEVPKPLSKEETKVLLENIKSGDEESIQILIEHNLRLVLKQVSKNFNNLNYDKLELISIGNSALIKAARAYDVNKNIEFSTFATRCIINEINLLIRKTKKEPIIQSYDEPIYDDRSNQELLLKNILRTNENIEDNYIKSELYEEIYKFINELPEKEKIVIIMSFGFKNRRYTQKEIANKLNISQATVSYFINRGLNKLKEKLINNKLIEINNNKLRHLKNR